MEKKIMPPIHPREILMKEFLEPMGISQYRLAKDISVVPRKINEIVHGKRAITADTALRLARYFGASEKFWMNLQTRYAMELQKDVLRDRLECTIEEINQNILGRTSGALGGINHISVRFALRISKIAEPHP